MNIIKHLPLAIVLAALQVLEWAGITTISWYHYVTYFLLWHISHQWIPVNPVAITMKRDQITGKLGLDLLPSEEPEFIRLSIGTLQPNTGHVILTMPHKDSDEPAVFKAINIRGQGVYLGYECNGEPCSVVIVTGGSKHSPYVFDVDELRECNLWPFNPFKRDEGSATNRRPDLWLIVDNTKDDDPEDN